jgi:hypothetical protein
MILLAPHDNTLVENNETFTLQLSNPTGGATNWHLQSDGDQAPRQ